MEFNNKKASPPKYKMSFTVGGLFYQESIIAIDLYVKNKEWSKVRDKIIEENLFQTRTVSSLERICRETISRLKLLSFEQIEIMNEGSRQDQIQMLWIAVCMRYAFIREFAIEVIREKQSQGIQQAVWNAKGLPAAVYFCILKTNKGIQTMKMIKY